MHFTPGSSWKSSQRLITTYLPRVTARLGVPSHFTISAQGTQEGPQVHLSVTVTKPETDSNTNVKLHAVLTESNIAFPWQNQTTLENVNRLMLPDQNGTAPEAPPPSTSASPRIQPGNWPIAR